MSTPSPARLPEPRQAGSPYTIAIVCLGNICRSPTADVVLTHKLAEAGLDRVTAVRSAGTGDWHMGDPMDRRAAATLVDHGYDPSQHEATHFDTSWFARHDLVLAMDGQNLRDIKALVQDEADRARIMPFRALDPLVDDSLDVPDPFYGGQDDFETVLALIERTSDALVAALAARLSTADVDVRSAD